LFGFDVADLCHVVCEGALKGKGRKGESQLFDPEEGKFAYRYLTGLNSYLFLKMFRPQKVAQENRIVSQFGFLHKFGRIFS